MERTKLLRQLSQVQFALWELHLYLDTHPCDEKASQLHAQYEHKYSVLKAEFEEKFGPLSPKTGEGAEWLKNPWPWDTQECDC
ncbi:MAG: spore coat protein CotJB [Clostridia bacterium]|nr:spore coat protein CotJB [Clostridia bacterium]